MEALDKLGINLGLLIAYTANVVFMLIILRVTAFGPIVKMLKQRRERIAEGINNARKAEEALASAEADRQKIIEKARAEAQSIVNEARARAGGTAKQVADEAEEDARRIRIQAEADAADERDRLLSEMRDQIVSISMAAANRLIGASLDEKQQHKLVEDFFTAIPEGASELGDSFVVITAVPLTEAEIKRFKKELGSEDVTFMTDPGILGGVIVRAGGQQLDGSFANQLASMKTSLL